MKVYWDVPLGDAGDALRIVPGKRIFYGPMHFNVPTECGRARIRWTETREHFARVFVLHKSVSPFVDGRISGLVGVFD